MKCPKCQSDNPDSLKFCGDCGTKLEKFCPKCNAANPLKFKFCGECGQQLSLPSKPVTKELSFDEKIAKIQKYLPGGLTEKILAQRGKIEGERKQVTVMFTDMEGFTPLVEKLGPEEAYSIMDQVYEILIHKVHEYEGTVNEMTGDGIMALFGAPIALEDAPQRAIRSGLAIHQEIARFSDRMRQEKGIPQIKMRIGVHTGPVVVGTLGNDLRVEFKAVGDTVNLASRLQNLAEAGTTYVTGETFKLSEGLFRFESLGQRTVKGRGEPVSVYQVIAPSSRRTRFDVSAERGLTPFIGRVREMELLLDGLARIKEGRGQAFSIIGEAGIGKSRLLYEFRKAVTNENITFLEGKCLSYGRGAAYHPITDILKGAFGMGVGGGDSQIRERVENGLKALKIDPASTLPYILELLGVKDSGIEKISMSPEGKRDRIIETLKQTLLRSSELRALVIAIEDLHWADKSTEDVLKYVLEAIPAAKVLVIFTYRPEFVHTWGGKSYHNQLTLNRLSNRETWIMATSLLGTDQVEIGIEELILSRTEGVPFFIEEFIKSLKDLHIIKKEETKYRLAKRIEELKIPSTIQDMIMARVDALSPYAKELLQIGSVIEREFSYGLIKRVTRLSDQELFTGFSVLKDSELLYERGIFPESTYIFKHALTREVVYDSLLAAKKKVLHEEVGTAIEEENQDYLEVHYGVLAGHYMASENYGKAAEYSRLAGRKAEKAGALNDAITHTQNRVFCCEQMPVSSDVDLRIIDSRVALGLCYSQMTLCVEAEQSIAPIVDLSIRRNYRKRLGQIYTILGGYYYHLGSAEKAMSNLEEALRISIDIHDTLTEVVATQWLALLSATYADFKKSERLILRSQEINTFVNNKWGIAAAKGLLSWFYYFWGEIDKALENSRDAIRFAEESGDSYSKGIAWSCHGSSLFAKGLLNRAEEFLLRAVETCDRINLCYFSVWSYHFLGEIALEKKDFENGLKYFIKSLGFQNRVSAFWTPFTDFFVARAQVLLGKHIDSRPLCESWGEMKANFSRGWTAKVIAEILSQFDHSYFPEAEEWIQKAIAADQKYGMRFHLGRDFVSYFEMQKRKGDLQKAREALSSGIETLRECGADGWVEKYEKELANIS